MTNIVYESSIYKQNTREIVKSQYSYCEIYRTLLCSLDINYIFTKHKYI